MREACSPEHMLAIQIQTESLKTWTSCKFMQLLVCSINLKLYSSKISHRAGLSRRFKIYSFFSSRLVKQSSTCVQLSPIQGNLSRSWQVGSSGLLCNSCQWYVSVEATNLQVERDAVSLVSEWNELKWVTVFVCRALWPILIQIFHPLYLQQEFAAKWCPVH